MARNPHFSQKVRSEQNLYEDIVIESLKMFGQDVYYLPREEVGRDRILGDEIPARFGSSYKLEMYVENTEGFDGEGDLFSKFGIEIRDEATFIVARRRWKTTVSRIETDIIDRPREGDLIYLELSKSLFVINHVEHEQPFYQLSNLPVYRLRCSLFEYNDEDLDTGVEEIDMIERDNAYTYTLTLDNTSMLINEGDTVTQVVDSDQGVTIRGEVTHWEDNSKVVTLAHVGASDGQYREFITGRSVTINDSDFTVISVDEDNRIMATEQNDDFDDFTVDFLDFTEDNPFGDPENN